MLGILRQKEMTV
ncbi:hypothetical protein OIU74_013334, partial [Salix koriyanagi]